MTEFIAESAAYKSHEWHAFMTIRSGQDVSKEDTVANETEFSVGLYGIRNLPQIVGKAAVGLFITAEKGVVE